MPGRSTAADGMDDFHAVAVGQGVADVQAAGDDLVVHFHGDAALAVAGVFKQLGDGRGGGAVARTAIERDVHPSIVAADGPDAAQK